MDGARSVVEITTEAGEKIQLPAFTCVHCQSIVVKHPERKRERHFCLSCHGDTCDNAGCVSECNPIVKDKELAYRDVRSQPWMVRDEQGFPVDRITIDGESYDVRRKDSGYTNRQLESMSRGE